MTHPFSHQYVQPMLLKLDTTSVPSRNGSANFNDPAFTGNKSQPIHRWVPWIAGYSSEFVRDVIRRFGNGNTVVLDPFAGVGTTLLEANLCGYDAIGFEINPYAAFASSVKTSAHHISVSELEKEASRFREFYTDKLRREYVPKSVSPQGFRTRSPFYSPNVLSKILILHDFVQGILDAQITALFKLAFAATMVTYSNYSYEPSLGRRVSAGKGEIQDYPVGELIFHQLSIILEDIKWLQRQESIRETQTKIINDSFFNYASHLNPESTDLVITSPPYLNNYHYNRNTRPHLYWLGFVSKPGDLKPLEESNFGKYWQTVREEKRIELQFTLSGSDLAEKIEFLRGQKVEKGIYGGNGWANYAASYFNDCYKFAQGLEYTLRRGGSAFIVIGNSILQGVMFSTDQYFAQIAELVNLELIHIDIPRATRVGNSIIQSSVRSVGASDKHSLYEAIVELRMSD